MPEMSVQIFIECDEPECMTRFVDKEYCMEACPCFIKAKAVDEKGGEVVCRK